MEYKIKALISFACNHLPMQAKADFLKYTAWFYTC